jgi:hypothetical protein
MGAKLGGYSPSLYLRVNSSLGPEPIFFSILVVYAPSGGFDVEIRECRHLLLDSVTKPF